MLFRLEQSCDELSEEVAALKRRVRKLEKQQKDSTSTQKDKDEDQEIDTSIYNGQTIKQLRETFQYTTNKREVLGVLARKMFTKDELIKSSITGKRGSKVDTAKPCLDPTRLAYLQKLMIEHHSEVTHKWITEKLQNVQKVERRSSL